MWRTASVALHLILPDDILLTVIPFCNFILFFLWFWMVTALQLSSPSTCCVDWMMENTLMHFLIYLLGCRWGAEPNFFFSQFCPLLINGVKDKACLLFFVFYVCSCLCHSCFILPRLRFFFFFVCFPNLREQGLVHLKLHGNLHADQTGYLLSTKPS